MFFVFFELGLGFSFLFAFAGLIGGYLMFSPKKIDPRLKDLEKLHGITPAQIKQLVAEGKKKIAIMKKIGKDVSDLKVREQIDRICEIINNDILQFQTT